MLKTLVKLFYTKFYPVPAAKRAGVNINGTVKVTGSVDFGAEPWLVTIDNGVLIAQHVTFMTHDGSVWTVRNLDAKYAHVQKFGKIHIKEYAFLGAYSYILPNVTVGHHAVVAAGSVVTKDVPDNAVVAGVPAKVIGSTYDLAEKYLADTPEYKKWGSIEEKKITSAFIADFQRERKLQRINNEALLSNTQKPEESDI